MLFRSISGGPEGRPTAAAAVRLEELAGRWDRMRLVWQEVVTKDLPALNDKAKALSIGGIAIPAPTIVP